MKLGEILDRAAAEAARVGLDIADVTGHPLIVIGTNGDRLGSVDALTTEAGEIRLHLNVQ